MNVAWITLLLTAVFLTACANRNMESCAASMILIGPALLTLDCRPPAHFDQ